MSVVTTEFILTAIVMEITPGPNMTWLAILAARSGRAAGFAAVAGIATGLAILAIAAIAGMTAIMTAVPIAYDILRWAGVIFLGYLAVEAWLGERPGSAPDESGAARHFRRGLLINVLNPKAAAVFVTIIPAFAVGNGPTFWPTALLSAIYLVIATVAHGSIVAFASNFQRLLADPRREQTVRRVFAVALAGVAIWLLLATAR